TASTSSVVSLCQISTSVSPAVLAIARRRSASQIEPGNVMTTTLAPQCGDGDGRAMDILLGNVDAVVLDHRVGEELLAHLIDAGPLVARGVLELELDELAEPDALHLVEAEMAEAALDRLAGGIEHAGLQRHEDPD